MVVLQGLPQDVRGGVPEDRTGGVVVAVELQDLNDTRGLVRSHSSPFWVATSPSVLASRSMPSPATTALADPIRLACRTRETAATFASPSDMHLATSKGEVLQNVRLYSDPRTVPSGRVTSMGTAVLEASLASRC